MRDFFRNYSQNYVVVSHFCNNYSLSQVMNGYVKATKHEHKGISSRREKTEKQHKVDFTSQQPWTAVSAFLGLISMAQLTAELWVPMGLENGMIVECSLK